MNVRAFLIGFAIIAIPYGVLIAYLFHIGAMTYTG